MNLIYMFYFIMKSDYFYLYKEMRKVNKHTFLVLLDLFYSTLIYGSSFEDYFLYEFYLKNKKEKKSFITTVYAYRFFREMNDKQYIKFFRNKELFDKRFKSYIKRDTILIKYADKKEFIKWCRNKKEIIVKPLDGVQGKGIYKIRLNQKKDVVKTYNKLNKNYIVEEVIQQHHALNELNFSSVNSLRVITVNIRNKPIIIAAILRIGTGSVVDNFSEGGIAAPIDLNSGIIFKEAITKKAKLSYKQHPNSKIDIIGFQIPFWQSVKTLVLTASEEIPEVKTVGWDIAITANGPEIIEGNDNWNKNVFQLPYKRGKKSEIEQILNENRVN